MISLLKSKDKFSKWKIEFDLIYEQLTTEEERSALIEGVLDAVARLPRDCETTLPQKNPTEERLEAYLKGRSLVETEQKPNV